MQTQDVKNHSRIVPLFHFVALPLLVFVCIAALINCIQAIVAGDNFLNTFLILILTIAVILIAFFARIFALKAQDRAIKSEVNFRHYIATGKPLDYNLRYSQIIALRFAGDDEFVLLCKKAVEEKLSAKIIKQQITNWKADNHRV
jgi:Family of unknown function (DUF6526)